MKRWLSFLVVFFVTGVFSLAARDVTINVNDEELELPLEGAIIHVSGKADTECDADGSAKFVIDDNTKTIIYISYPGYETTSFTIPESGDVFSVPMHISGQQVLENDELIFTENRAAKDEGVTIGRGVAVPKEQLDKAGEMGLIEDVMSGIKLLPGVGYAGFFNALPSIRGGEPGDLTAVLDGLYISNPYHWGGAYSIFDPKMVKNAKLSHGVFSARYGHTISGVLEVESKEASSQYGEAELGVSTSAVNLAVSVPFSYAEETPELGGGISVAGKVTYWDPYVALTKGMSEFITALRPVKAVTTAPYIRSGALSGHYRWNNYTSANFNAYFGNDGVGVEFHPNDPAAELLGAENTDLEFSWNNIISFLSMSFLYNPRLDMILKASGGFVYHKMGYKTYERRGVPGGGRETIFDNYTASDMSGQGRLEYDWELNEMFLATLGAEELFTQWTDEEETNMNLDIRPPSGGSLYTTADLYTPNVKNAGFFTSAWTTVEWTSPGKKIKTEAGLRLDHIYFFNKTLKVSSTPELNPRINFDYTTDIHNATIDSLSWTLGTGLFSTMNDAVITLDSNTGLSELKQARSWTSVAGTQLAIAGGIGISLEAYYKYYFNRAYSYIEMISTGNAGLKFLYNGRAHIYGVELMLQRFTQAALTGWLSYSFNYARYRDPGRTNLFPAGFPYGYSDWYYPSFHRFHTANLVVNYRINQKLNLYTRLGFASGNPAPDHAVESYQNPKKPTQTKYRDAATYSDTRRDVFAMPLDIKLSYYFFNPSGKTHGELYCAIENTLVLVLPKSENKSLNPYTGEWEDGGWNGGYQLPIPMVSFGIKWMY